MQGMSGNTKTYLSNAKPGYPTGGAGRGSAGRGGAGRGEARRVGVEPGGERGRGVAGAGQGGAERFGQGTTFHFDPQNNEDNSQPFCMTFGSTDNGKPMQIEPRITMGGCQAVEELFITRTTATNCSWLLARLRFVCRACPGICLCPENVQDGFVHL